MIVGNDISNWQGDVNYDIFSKNAHFVILKATEGTGFTDKKFLRNQSEARRTGMLLGYYHFARPDLGNSPEAEAAYFLGAIGKIREGEMLCLDYEPASNPFNVVTWCLDFLRYIENKTGVKPLIYLNQSQVRNFDWKRVVDAGYGLWLAAYIPTDQAFTGQWQFMAMQQWTSSQKVPGIVGNVDGCYFFGTKEQFKAYGYHEQVVPSSSQSPSVSFSPSPTPSPSVSSSPSGSVSQSPSPSPSPSIEIPPEEWEQVVRALAIIIRSNWGWWGQNAWYKKLAYLRGILANHDL